MVVSTVMLSVKAVLLLLEELVVPKAVVCVKSFHIPTTNYFDQVYEHWNSAVFLGSLR